MTLLLFTPKYLKYGKQKIYSYPTINTLYYREHIEIK
jgi:hypothetical protein